jgi:uncharacterized protein
MQLIEEMHEFPGPYMLKVIGRTGGTFEADVMATTREVLELDVDPEHSKKMTPNGKHISLTLDFVVQSIDQLETLFERIKKIDDVVMTM